MKIIKCWPIHRLYRKDVSVVVQPRESLSCEMPGKQFGILGKNSRDIKSTKSYMKLLRPLSSLSGSIKLVRSSPFSSESLPDTCENFLLFLVTSLRKQVKFENSLEILWFVHPCTSAFYLFHVNYFELSSICKIRFLLIRSHYKLFYFFTFTLMIVSCSVSQLHLH